jgi:DNA modification methylase
MNAKYQVLEGDCLKLMQQIKPGTIDMAFADPPFNVAYDYHDYPDDLEACDYIHWCAQWMHEIHTLLKSDGAFWLAIGDEFVSELDVTAKKLGFIKRSHVVWFYTFGVNCSNNFSRSHTHLLYYVKSEKSFTFNKDEMKVRVPSNRALVYNDKRANPKGKLPDNTWILTKEALEVAFADAEMDTMLASRVCGTFNERADRGTKGERRGTPQMPIQIMERIVLATTRPGDHVLDPVQGTGTTGVAAVLHGRNYTGIDLSKASCDVSRSRLQDAHEKAEARKPCPPSRKPPSSSQKSSSKQPRSAQKTK